MKNVILAIFGTIVAMFFVVVFILGLSLLFHAGPWKIVDVIAVLIACIFIYTRCKGFLDYN